MSSEWVSVKLKDVATIRNGAGIKQNFFDTDGVPLVRVTNFTDTSIDLKDSVRVNVDHALKWQNHKLKAQDILIATVGSWPPNWSSVVGKAVSVPAAVAGAIQNQNTCCIQAIPGMADQRFLYYLARSQNFALYAANSASGSANQARLPVAKLECFEFHLPSLAEQKSIGSFLGALDDRITLLRETNTTLEAIAQALFKSWFVDFDPVHANAAFLENGQAPSLPAEIQALFPSRLVESPQGLIPEGWMVGCIGDVVSVKGGYAFKSADFQDSGLPVIKIKNIVGDGTVDVSDVQKVSETIASKAQRFALQSGDILMAMTGATIGKVGVFVSENEELAYLNQRVAKFENKSLDQKNTWLAFIAFSNAFMAEQIVNAASGSAQPNISAAGIESTRLVVPSDKLVLSSFNDLVEPLFTGWINNQKTIRTLANLRDTLLPRLISGQLRLPEAETALAEVG